MDMAHMHFETRDNQLHTVWINADGAWYGLRLVGVVEVTVDAPPLVPVLAGSNEGVVGYEPSSRDLKLTIVFKARAITEGAPLNGQEDSSISRSLPNHTP